MNAKDRWACSYNYPATINGTTYPVSSMDEHKAGFPKHTDVSEIIDSFTYSLDVEKSCSRTLAAHDSIDP